MRGPDHPLTLWPLWKLAELDRDRGQLDETDTMFHRSIKGYAKAQGDDGLDLATLSRPGDQPPQEGRAEPRRTAAARRIEAVRPPMKDDWRTDSRSRASSVRPSTRSRNTKRPNPS